MSEDTPMHDAGCVPDPLWGVRRLGVHVEHLEQNVVLLTGFDTVCGERIASLEETVRVCEPIAESQPGFLDLLEGEIVEALKQIRHNDRVAKRQIAKLTGRNTTLRAIVKRTKVQVREMQKALCGLPRAKSAARYSIVPSAGRVPLPHPQGLAYRAGRVPFPHPQGLAYRAGKVLPPPFDAACKKPLPHPQGPAYRGVQTASVPNTPPASVRDLVSKEAYARANALLLARVGSLDEQVRVLTVQAARVGPLTELVQMLTEQVARVGPLDEQVCVLTERVNALNLQVAPVTEAAFYGPGEMFLDGVCQLFGGPTVERLVKVHGVV
ncbi:hypothetical protein T484DRAFT_1859930 [Baffinella frigidus]|nr:hypothetical protein T484DRAFT_1859930 [Cryptophyta sp. CCMP2293]